MAVIDDECTDDEDDEAFLPIDFWTCSNVGCSCKGWAHEDENGDVSELCHVCTRRERNEHALQALLLHACVIPP